MYWIVKSEDAWGHPGETVFWGDIFSPEVQAGGMWTRARERARRFYDRKEALAMVKAMPSHKCRMIRVTRKGG
jgi:hypothetical protein